MKEKLITINKLKFWREFKKRVTGRVCTSKERDRAINESLEASKVEIILKGCNHV